MLQYLVILGVGLSLIGIGSYVRDTIRGKTKPNRVTWLLWAVAPLIATAAAVSEGVGWAVIPVFMSGFGPLLVFLASFVNKNSYWKLEKFDYLCGIFSLLALFLWWVTKEPSVAITFAIASDGLAAVPTLIKAWKFPETENANPFFAGIISSSTSFFAVKSWSFAEIAFPIYLVLINVMLIFTILRKKIFKIANVENSNKSKTSI